NENWYGLPMREDRSVLTAPYPYAIDGKQTLLSSIAVVLHKGGKPAGVVTSDLTLDVIGGVIGGLKPFGVGSVMLISDVGTWVASPDPGAVGQPLDAQAAAALLNNAAMEAGQTYDAGGVTNFIVTTPLTFAGVN